MPMFPVQKNNLVNWQPTISLTNLRLRAKVLSRIREFFHHKEVLEVETPILSQATVSDPHLHSLSTTLSDYRKMYLQTSPEFAMKRLLAADSGSIYQIAKVFRDDELGQRHNPEFTLLEWYRLGFDHHQLMDEVSEFLQYVGDFKAAKRKSYQAVFYEYLGFDPLIVAVETLVECASAHDISHNMTDTKKNLWLNLLLSHIIEPKLGYDYPIFIYDFPASQAALAKIRADETPVAERFELFINGMEVANGFHELTDANEQRLRFQADLEERKQQGLPELPMDEFFLASLENGLPECAGVALGVDRLLMTMSQVKSIKEVISFNIENA